MVIAYHRLHTKQIFIANYGTQRRRRRRRRNETSMIQSKKKVESERAKSGTNCSILVPIRPLLMQMQC
jgi:hypothetical protein